MRHDQRVNDAVLLTPDQVSPCSGPSSGPLRVPGSFSFAASLEQVWLGRVVIVENWTGFAGPGLAVKWMKPGAASRPWGFFLRGLARASLARPRGDCRELDWLRRTRFGREVDQARGRFASLGLFPSRPRSSNLGSAAKEKAPAAARPGLHHQVPRTGLEPARRLRHYPLKVACLPISPPGQAAIRHGCRVARGRKYSRRQLFLRRWGLPGRKQCTAAHSQMR